MTEARTLLARPAGFLSDVLAISTRSLRAVARERDVLAVTLIFPPLFFAATVGSLEGLGTFIGINDFRAFQLPVIIVLAVTGVSRAMALVIDIQTGYFDRLLASPVNRAALLLGLMGADLVVVVAVSGFVLLMGLLFGVQIITGPVGVLVFLLLAGFWGLAFNGFLYAYALRTGSPSVVNVTFVLFMPLAFLTTLFVPRHALSSWLATVADFNPVTYVLAGLRALIGTGWVGDVLAAVLAIGGMAALSFTLAFLALRGRLRRG